MAPRPVRVLVVDDDPDIRGLVRACCEIDGRFQVVAEAADGAAAPGAAAAAGGIDLVVLDRDMPGVDGITALPSIRAAAPGAEVVLYTARADPETRQAAVAAGALEVVDKSTAGMVLIDRLAATLVSHWADGDAIDIHVGPVPSTAALRWVDSSRRILDAVVAHPDVAGIEVAPDDAAMFAELLEDWRALAAAGPTFRWAARATTAEVDRLVRAWAAIDDLSDERLAALGCTWSPPEARPFFEALTAGVLAGLARHEETVELAATLQRQWSGEGPQ